VYFLHPEWRLHWGGLLLVLDDETEGEDPATEGIVCPWLLDDDENRRVWSPGYGRVILPKPNRMVFLSREAQHSVTAVTQGVRLSVGGFFRHPRVVRM
jgi:Rps23 Pro-64 3,4-dihydroxylase Tpa1-like proline 4-hydroxylase